MEALSDSKNAKKFVDQIASLLEQQKAETLKQTDALIMAQSVLKEIEIKEAVVKAMEASLDAKIGEAEEKISKAKALMSQAEEKNSLAEIKKLEFEALYKKQTEDLAKSKANLDLALVSAVENDKKAHKIKTELEEKLNNLKKAMG
jgi:hypothetical protein